MAIIIFLIVINLVYLILKLNKTKQEGYIHSNKIYQINDKFKGSYKKMTQTGAQNASLVQKQGKRVKVVLLKNKTKISHNWGD